MPIDYVQNADGYVYYSNIATGEIGRMLITALMPPGNATVGSGPDTLALSVSQDRYNDNAQYLVSVDGVQIGGIMRALAKHGTGQPDAVNVLGNWAPGVHTVTVNFLNDAWGGSPSTDRNLYLNSATYDGVKVPGAALFLGSTGPQNFSFQDGVVIPPVIPGSTTIGTGPDTLALKISQDAFEGSAQYTISVDNIPIGGTLTAAAPHGSGASDTVNVLGEWGNGPHKATVNFLNDTYRGTPATDRNLYVDGATFDGATVANAAHALLGGGPADIAFVNGTPAPTGTTIGAGPDTLVLNISQDAYNGPAQYTISVDGVPIGGTLTAMALHGSGQADTISVLGAWSTGTHKATINFLNDEYAGTPATDRNLYVDSASFKGIVVPGSSLPLLSSGPVDIGFVV